MKSYTNISEDMVRIMEIQEYIGYKKAPCIGNGRSWIIDNTKVNYTYNSLQHETDAEVRISEIIGTGSFEVQIISEANWLSSYKIPTSFNTKYQTFSFDENFNVLIITGNGNYFGIGNYKVVIY